jgi:hypothetical protein
MKLIETWVHGWKIIDIKSRSLSKEETFQIEYDSYFTKQ